MHISSKDSLPDEQDFLRCFNQRTAFSEQPRPNPHGSGVIYKISCNLKGEEHLNLAALFAERLCVKLPNGSFKKINECSFAYQISDCKAKKNMIFKCKLNVTWNLGVENSINLGLMVRRKFIPILSEYVWSEYQGASKEKALKRRSVDVFQKSLGAVSASLYSFPIEQTNRLDWSSVRTQSLGSSNITRLDERSYSSNNHQVRVLNSSELNYSHLDTPTWQDFYHEFSIQEPQGPPEEEFTVVEKNFRDSGVAVAHLANSANRIDSSYNTRSRSRLEESEESLRESEESNESFVISSQEIPVFKKNLRDSGTAVAHSAIVSSYNTRSRSKLGNSEESSEALVISSQEIPEEGPYVEEIHETPALLWETSYDYENFDKVYINFPSPSQDFRSNFVGYLRKVQRTNGGIVALGGHPLHLGILLGLENEKKLDSIAKRQFIKTIKSNLFLQEVHFNSKERKMEITYLGPLSNFADITVIRPHDTECALHINMKKNFCLLRNCPLNDRTYYNIMLEGQKELLFEGIFLVTSPPKHETLEKMLKTQSMQRVLGRVPWYQDYLQGKLDFVSF